MSFSELNKVLPASNKSQEVLPGQSGYCFFPQKTRPVKVGRTIIGGTSFSVIAGPCAIENQSQFLEVARGVKSLGAVLLRGGIWKLRTNSKSFQGLGDQAFGFIKDVLEVTDLDLVTEVTDPRQIEAMDPFVAMYQVGSRNMHNYALLKELGQTRKPVLLKRGFSAYVTEWIKAAEYVEAGGNPNVVLCERGIRTFENATRNTLDLNGVIYAKAHTNLPVIVDPSHAVGARELIPNIAMAAAAVGCDGLILEVHPRPQEALSDADQALTLDDFAWTMERVEKILTALDRPLNRPKESMAN